MKKATLASLATVALASSAAMADATFQASVGSTTYEQEFAGSKWVEATYNDLDIAGIFSIDDSSYWGISYRTSLGAEHDGFFDVSQLSNDFERTDFAISYGGTIGDSSFFTVGYQVGSSEMSNDPLLFSDFNTNTLDSSGFFMSVGVGFGASESGQFSAFGGLAFMEAEDKTNVGFSEDYDLSVGFSWGIKYTGYFSDDSDMSWFVGYDGKYMTYDAAVELVDELDESLNRLSFGVTF
ncbi:MAG: hypothetical protein V2I33_04500 [Kangiellaceae bacterium]|jgi:hypothetical protein|nr:hypothetical protein [Kangiellaceae bacterium]